MSYWKKHTVDHIKIFNSIEPSNQIKVSMVLSVLLLVIGTTIIGLFHLFGSYINNFCMLLIGILCAIWGFIVLKKGNDIYYNQVNEIAGELARQHIRAREHRNNDLLNDARRARESESTFARYYMGVDPAYGIGPVRQNLNNVYEQQARAMRDLQLAQMIMQPPQPIRLTDQQIIDKLQSISKPKEEKPIIPIKIVNSILSLEI